MRKRWCVLLSGLSGSGKSTVGPAVAAALPDCVFVEGDSFYHANKPTVVLSTGEAVSNWDSVDALDWGRLNAEVEAQLRAGNVLLATFLPNLDLLAHPPAVHVSLAYAAGIGDQETLELCIGNRRAAKQLSGRERLENLTVREVVYPTYRHFMERFPPDHTVYTYVGAGAETRRRPVQDIVGDVIRAVCAALGGQNEL
jgi:hypothetical protein